MGGRMVENDGLRFPENGEQIPVLTSRKSMRRCRVGNEVERPGTVGKAGGVGGKRERKSPK